MVTLKHRAAGCLSWSHSTAIDDEHVLATSSKKLLYGRGREASEWRWAWRAWWASRPEHRSTAALYYTAATQKVEAGEEKTKQNKPRSGGNAVGERSNNISNLF
ncbi:hypothetical protein Drorol1_Dr00024822 [Drosera rotundifolia]